MLVSISQLDFAYGEHLVLKHVDLDVERGGALGLIGPNGGGKTTLLKLLLGLLKPTRGTIRIADMTPPQAVRRGGILGYLPQRPNVPVNFPLNVRQVVRQGLIAKTGMLRGYAKDDLDFVESLLDQVGIHDLSETAIGELSGGQQQRAFIARAVAARPQLLLLDEPTTGIDAGAQQKFIQFLQELRNSLKLTLIFTTHDLRAAAALCDRIACLNVTLHAHDVPERIPAGTLYRMFACDVDVLKGPVQRE